MNDFLDKAKDMAGEHPDQVQGGLDKAEEFANEKTGDKYADQIGQGADAAGNALGLGGEEEQQPEA